MNNEIIVADMRPAEIAERDQYVAFVKENLRTVFEVGRVLTLIREKRLYRASHATFADFCAEHFSITDRRARQLMVAAEIGTIVPEITNEAQAREIARVAPADRTTVLSKAKELSGGTLTASAIRSAAEMGGGLSADEKRRLDALEQKIDWGLRELARLEMREADRLRHPDLHQMVTEAKAYVARKAQLEGAA
jgi:hypothetical protein